MDATAACSNGSLEAPCYEEASGPLAVIVIPSLLTASTISVVALIFLSLYRNRRARRTARVRFSNAGLQCVSTSPPGAQEDLRPWELPEQSSLEALRFCQQGCYGPVCYGVLRRDGTSTAVVLKFLRDGSGPAESKEFVDWVRFHAAVCRHSNVVKMLHCRTKLLPAFLMLEACSPGNLLLFLWSLRNRDEPRFSERSAFVLARQVAAGLDYLMSEHRLVHGDVAARNVLVGPDLCARVAGLGAAFIGRSASSVARRRAMEVPVKWQAPERILRLLSIDRSDVWSFGIFLYELITLGAPPYPELEPSSVFQHIQKSHRMKRPDHCGGPLYDLMKYCWMWSYKDRPAFSAIIKLLESYQHLAATSPLFVPELVDVAEYRRLAGLVGTQPDTHVAQNTLMAQGLGCNRGVQVL